VELFFAGGFPTSMEDEPIRVCEYYDFDDDYYGYRACSNMIAAGVVNILVCIILLIIDLFNPCLNSGVSKSCLAYSSSLSLNFISFACVDMLQLLSIEKLACLSPHARKTTLLYCTFCLKLICLIDQP